MPGDCEVSKCHYYENSQCTVRTELVEVRTTRRAVHASTVLSTNGSTSFSSFVVLMSSMIDSELVPESQKYVALGNDYQMLKRVQHDDEERNGACLPSIYIWS